MKRCKKLLCLVLALIMALSLCTVAMADDPETGESGASSFEITLGGFYYGSKKSDCNVISVKKDGSLIAAIDLGESTEGSLGYSASVQYTAGSSVVTENNWIGALHETNNRAGRYQLKVSFINATNMPESVNNYTLKLLKYSSPGVVKMENSAPVYEDVTAAIVNPSGENSTASVVFNLPLTVENYTKYIPFTKVVELGGNTEPGAQRFELEWMNKPVGVTVTTPGGTQNESEDDPATHVDVTGYVDTNGAGTYTGNICVAGPKYYVDLFMEQGEIYVREKNSGAAGWEYDDQLWLIKYDSAVTDGDALTFIKVNNMNYVCPGTHENAADHFTVMTFTNTYTENTVVVEEDAPTHEPIRRQHAAPVAEPEAPVASPKTGDMGVALYAAMAVLSMSGSAVILGKKRSK